MPLTSFPESAKLISLAIVVYLSVKIGDFIFDWLKGKILRDDQGGERRKGGQTFLMIDSSSILKGLEAFEAHNRVMQGILSSLHEDKQTLNSHVKEANEVNIKIKDLYQKLIINQ